MGIGEFLGGIIFATFIFVMVYLDNQKFRSWCRRQVVRYFEWEIRIHQKEIKKYKKQLDDFINKGA